LDKYSFSNLRGRKFAPQTITFDKVLNETPDFVSYLFFYDSEGKKVSGLVNLPKKAGTYPVILQFRGYIDRGKYTTGMGTVHSGEVFAQNGFITLAPDFLGYGQSASPSALPIEERFETYTTALNLLSSTPNLNEALKNANITGISADTDKIGIWGHSNGGHIALSVLEITGGKYPTVLWNPVSKPFPYSILYYTDEAEDNGKALRKLVADFEKDYEAENYSPANYFDWINAPIELHQGEADEAVPLKWSDLLYKTLKNSGKEITYFTYPRDNHDFNNGSWNTVVARNILFYKNHL
jgi:dipeptidyl aminopeptidase/acylaminoacyl peptidase